MEYKMAGKLLQGTVTVEAIVVYVFWYKFKLKLSECSALKLEVLE